MAFGQQSGPPATHRQVTRLLELLEGAGHADFRDARGPMGFTQRQAGGKFTGDEADAFITQLENEEFIRDGATPEQPEPSPTPSRTKRPASAPARTSATTTRTGTARALRACSDEQLAAELQRRGWIVIEP